MPTLQIDWLSPEQQRAYVLADNRLAEKAGWDKELLALELGELSDFEIDITLTGFDLREIELIMDAGDSPVPEDDVPVIETGPAVCRPGDLWQLGRHRLLCGDALDHVAPVVPGFNLPDHGLLDVHMDPGLAGVGLGHTRRSDPGQRNHSLTTQATDFHPVRGR